MLNLEGLGIQFTQEPVHNMFMRETILFASQNSPENSMYVGATVFPDDPSGECGTNGYAPVFGTSSFPGVHPFVLQEKIHDREWKYAHVKHAEVTAIDRAIEEYGRTGIENVVDGSSMIVSIPPCLPCATHMTDYGVKAFVGHLQGAQKLPERWYESCREGLEHLRDNGVKMMMVDNHFGIKTLIDGQEVIV